MRFKIGSFRRKNVIIKKFKEWEKKEGRYPITTILLPLKYPSGAILFKVEDENNIIYVRLTINSEKLKELLKSLNFRKNRDKRGIVLHFVLEENEYGIDIENNEKYGYYWTGKGWKLTRQTQEEKENDEIDEIDF